MRRWTRIYRRGRREATAFEKGLELGRFLAGTGRSSNLDLFGTRQTNIILKITFLSLQSKIY